MYCGPLDFDFKFFYLSIYFFYLLTTFQSQQDVESHVGYFIFVILSECDIHFRLPKSKKTPIYQIIFKPNMTNKPNYGKTLESKYLDGVCI